MRIDAETLEPTIGVIGGGTQVTGVCGSGIIDAIAEMFLAGIIDADGTIRGELAGRTRRVVADGRTFSYVLHDEPLLRITQNDVRAIQLAKAALRAGIDLLAEHAGNPPITDIRLAGRSARTSTRCGRWPSASCPTVPSTASLRRQRCRCRRRRRTAVARRARRWRLPCAA